MLDDFRRSSVATAPRKRFIGSMALAVALYAALAAALIAATAHVGPPIEVEVLLPVPYNPKTTSPPSPPTAVQDHKTAPPPTRRHAKAPDKVATTVLPETDAPLPSSAAPLDPDVPVAPAAAAERLVMTEPPIAPAPVIRPRELPGYRYSHLEYPPRALRTAISGAVVVEFDVLPDGSVAAPRIVSGPVEFHETVLAAARGWRFEPAHQAGKPVRYRLTKRIVFRLEDA